MVGTRRLNHLVESALERLDLPGGRLVIALSGGADSAALAYLCSAAGTEARCVHVNHGLPGSPLMQTAAEGVAEALSLSLDVINVVLGEGPSPEGQARKARYEALAEVEGQVLTAHTLDDDVETVLFNLIRGTGPRGLAGIPYHRAANVYRPMLSISRSETREMATLAGLPFADDPMNESLALSRNIIRSRVIPMLLELNPRLSEAIVRMAGAVEADGAYLDSEVAKIRVLRGDDAHAVAVGDLLAAPRPVRDRALKTLLAGAAGPGGVTSERLDVLWSVATRQNKRQQIGDGLIADRRGPLLVVEVPARAPPSVVELTPGYHRQGSLDFEVTVVEDVCKVAPLSRWAAVFPADASLIAGADGWVTADGERAWKPGEKRLPVAWYEPGSVGYLSVFASEVTGWTSSH